MPPLSLNPANGLSDGVHSSEGLVVFRSGPGVTMVGSLGTSTEAIELCNCRRIVKLVDRRVEEYTLELPACRLIDDLSAGKGATAIPYDHEPLQPDFRQPPKDFGDGGFSGCRS